VINRSTTRDTPIDPMAIYLVALLFGTLVAETILASVHVRAHQQAGHMGASDLIKALQKHLARRGPSTYGSSSLMWTAPEVASAILLCQNASGSATDQRCQSRPKPFGSSTAWSSST
jgi:hypothetical protein